MRAGHRLAWFVGMYVASVTAIALASLTLKKILAFLI